MGCVSSSEKPVDNTFTDLHREGAIASPVQPKEGVQTPASGVTGASGHLKPSINDVFPDLKGNVRKKEEKENKLDKNKSFSESNSSFVALDDNYFTENEKALYERPRLQDVVEDNLKINWRKGDLLGQGAFGSVYQGFNSDTGGLMGVKQVSLAKIKQNDDLYVVALEKEIALLRTLKHENIVQYLGSERTDEFFNIFLEYVPGGSLASILKKFGAFTEPVIRKYTYQILKGLEYLHSHQIMHRDIKGANILVDDNAHCKLADFGASVLIENVSNDDHKSIAGTPYWMAPEVIKQSGHGRQADIWSVGCTILEMATAAPPWSNCQSTVAAMYKIAETTELPPFPKSLSANAVEFIKLCLERDTKKRPNVMFLLRHPFLAGVEQELAEPRVVYQNQSSTSPIPISSNNLIVNVDKPSAQPTVELNINADQLKAYAEIAGLTAEEVAAALQINPDSKPGTVKSVSEVLSDDEPGYMKGKRPVRERSVLDTSGDIDNNVVDSKTLNTSAMTPSAENNSQVMDSIISRIKVRNNQSSRQPSHDFKADQIGLSLISTPQHASATNLMSLPSISNNSNRNYKSFPELPNDKTPATSGGSRRRPPQNLSVAITSSNITSNSNSALPSPAIQSASDNTRPTASPPSSQFAVSPNPGNVPLNGYMTPKNDDAGFRRPKIRNPKDDLKEETESQHSAQSLSNFNPDFRVVSKLKASTTVSAVQGAAIASLVNPNVHARATTIGYSNGRQR